MREVPTVTSNDNDIVAASVDYRRGFFDRGDWYVKWQHRHRPWEYALMRLPLSQLSGRATLGAQDFEYRVHWRWEVPLEPVPA